MVCLGTNNKAFQLSLRRAIPWRYGRATAGEAFNLVPVLPRSTMVTCLANAPFWGIGWC